MRVSGTLKNIKEAVTQVHTQYMLLIQPFQ